MTAFDYSSLLSTSNQLIGRFGRTAILYKPGVRTGPSYNSVPGAEQSLSVVVVSVKAKGMDSVMSMNLNATGLFLLRVLEGVEPSVGDFLDYGAGRQRVAHVEVVAPGNTALLHKVWTD